MTEPFRIPSLLIAVGRVVPPVSVSLSVCLLGICLIAACGRSDPESSGQEPDDSSSREEVPPGRWHSRRDTSNQLTPKQEQTIRKLESLGYLGESTTPISSVGVTTNVKPEVDAAASFYLSGHAPEAVLIDINGSELHRWRYGLEEMLPDVPDRTRNAHNYWRRAHLFENGDMLAMFATNVKGLFKIDKDSQMIWVRPDLFAHHDLDVAANGDIYVLTRTAHVVSQFNKTQPILEDFITVLGADGETNRSVSILDCLDNSEWKDEWIERRSKLLKPCERYWARGEPSPSEDAGLQFCGDPLHTNTIEILDGSLEAKIPAFKAGNLLISMRFIHTIAVVDLEREQVVWMHSGEYSWQHDPQVVADGHVILFDNKGPLAKHGTEGRTWSSVLEFDPLTSETVWRHQGSEKQPLFSSCCGTVQRLPNGNTLITETNGGRALEVNSAQKTVWEFHNPNAVGEDGGYVAVLMDLVRLASDFPLEWAGSSASAAP